MQYIAKTDIITKEQDEFFDILYQHIHMIWSTLNEMYKKLNEKDENLLEELLFLGFENREQLEDRDYVFNRVYHFAFIHVLNKLYNYSLIMEHDEMFKEIPEFLKVIKGVNDVETKKELGIWYAKQFNSEKDQLMHGLQNRIGSKLAYKAVDGKFTIDIENDKREYIEYFVRDLEIRLNNVYNNFDDYATNQAAADLAIMKELFAEFKENEKLLLANYQLEYKTRKERLGLFKKMTKKQIDEFTKLTNHKVQQLAADKKYDLVYRKYPTIISWMAHNGDFEEETFKKVIYDRFWNLSKDNFDIETIYLLKSTRQYPDYDRTRNTIYNAVALNRSTMKKIMEEKNKKSEDSKQELTEFLEKKISEQ